MRAVVQESFGEPEVLRLDQAADPEPAAGEVRIRVAAAGVHLIDTRIRRGERSGPLPPPLLPLIPGREVAGTVDLVGDQVAARWLGRRVVADLGPRSGGYAELAIAAETALQQVPDHVDMDTAVAMVGTGRTAMAILDLAKPVPGDVAIVTGAGGGIGTLLVQALQQQRATVIALVRGPAKVAALHAIGAEHAIDIADGAWTDRALDLTRGAASLVLDGVGGATGRAALELLAVGGRLVLFGAAAGQLTPLTAEDLFTRGITASAAVGARHLARGPDGLRELERRALAAASAGTLVPVIHPPFALQEAAAAHQAVESRTTIGKVVLHPIDSAHRSPSWR